MIPILTPEEAAALDVSSAERGVPVADLMERAGWETARATAASMGGAYGRRAVVVCGKGNNGGDGLVAARYLLRWGTGVTVILVAEPDAYRGEAARNLARFEDLDGRIVPWSRAAFGREAARADVVVDAIFGTGFRGAPEGRAAEAVGSIAGSARPVVAVDVPSGVDAGSGAVAGPAVRADVTVTFGALKPGLVFEPGSSLAGDVRVVGIGFPRDLVRSDAWLMEVGDAATLVPERAADAHKRSTGVVLVVAGSRDMVGAGILATRAAARAGAGLVTLAAPRSALPVAQSAVVEAIFLALPETEAGRLAEAAWAPLAERLGSAHAVAVGPGLGTDPETSAVVRRLVAECPVPFVLDADGLNAFAGRTAEISHRRTPCVLTPHAGEFARLTGVAASEVAGDRIGHARKAAAELAATVVLKGPGTVVAEPSGLARVSPSGGPNLATGGTGDVLTGTIAAFLARGVPPSDAAVLGAFVHGAAGDLAALDLGDGTLASDVAERLPAVLLALADVRSSPTSGGR